MARRCSSAGAAAGSRWRRQRGRCEPEARVARPVRRDPHPFLGTVRTGRVEDAGRGHRRVRPRGGADPDAPAVRETIRQTVEFSDEIQLQDIAICEAVQKGLKSRTYDRGRFSVRRENGVHHFHSLLARALRED